jgi:hypothetical protein
VDKLWSGPGSASLSLGDGELETPCEARCLPLESDTYAVELAIRLKVIPRPALANRLPPRAASARLRHRPPR